MSRFNFILNKLDPNKKAAIIAWIKNVPNTAHDPITENIANNLKTEEHFNETALENFLNKLGEELIKSPNIDQSTFEILVKNYILKGDRITVSIPSNKHYRLVALDSLKIAMKIPPGEKDKVLALIRKRYKNKIKRPMKGKLGFEEPVWSTFEWPNPQRPYDGFSPRKSLDKSGLNWIDDEDAIELVFHRKTVKPIKYPTVADAGWNSYFRVSDKGDNFGYTRDLKTGKKGFPETVHSNAKLQEALLESPRPLI